MPRKPTQISRVRKSYASPKPGSANNSSAPPVPAEGALPKPIDQMSTKTARIKTAPTAAIGGDNDLFGNKHTPPITPVPRSWPALLDAVVRLREAMNALYELAKSATGSISSDEWLARLHGVEVEHRMCAVAARLARNEGAQLSAISDLAKPDLQPGALPALAEIYTQANRLAEQILREAPELTLANPDEVKKWFITPLARIAWFPLRCLDMAGLLLELRKGATALRPVPGAPEEQFVTASTLIEELRALGVRTEPKQLADNVRVILSRFVQSHPQACCERRDVEKHKDKLVYHKAIVLPHLCGRF